MRIHYENEWEKYYGQHDITQEANAARKKMILELSVEEKINIMFDDFLWSKGNQQIINLANIYGKNKQEDTVEGSN